MHSPVLSWPEPVVPIVKISRRNRVRSSTAANRTNASSPNKDIPVLTKELLNMDNSEGVALCTCHSGRSTALSASSTVLSGFSSVISDPSPVLSPRAHSPVLSPRVPSPVLSPRVPSPVLSDHSTVVSVHSSTSMDCDDSMANLLADYQLLVETKTSNDLTFQEADEELARCNLLYTSMKEETDINIQNIADIQTHLDEMKSVYHIYKLERTKLNCESVTDDMSADMMEIEVKYTNDKISDKRMFIDWLGEIRGENMFTINESASSMKDKSADTSTRNGMLEIQVERLKQRYDQYQYEQAAKAVNENKSDNLDKEGTRNNTPTNNPSDHAPKDTASAEEVDDSSDFVSIDCDSDTADGFKLRNGFPAHSLTRKSVPKRKTMLERCTFLGNGSGTVIGTGAPRFQSIKPNACLAILRIAKRGRNAITSASDSAWRPLPNCCKNRLAIPEGIRQFCSSNLAKSISTCKLCRFPKQTQH